MPRRCLFYPVNGFYHNTNIHTTPHISLGANYVTKYKLQDERFAKKIPLKLITRKGKVFPLRCFYSVSLWWGICTETVADVCASRPRSVRLKVKTREKDLQHDNITNQSKIKEPLHVSGIYWLYRLLTATNSLKYRRHFWFLRHKETYDRKWDVKRISVKREDWYLFNLHATSG